MKPDEVEPGTYVAPSSENPWPVATPVKPDADAVPIVMDRDLEHRVPELNLLQDTGSTEAATESTAPQEVAPAEQPQPLPAVPQIAKGKRKVLPIVIALLVLVAVCAAAGGYYLLSQKPASSKVATTPSPSPTPKSSPSTTPSPSPSPTPTPSLTPTPTPAPLTVTTPTVAPTTSHPQTVTITSKSGLWLRSSPNSSNKNNIIDWMPDQAQVSVDSVGTFWWHGTYKGIAGYFASTYTQ